MPQLIVIPNWDRDFENVRSRTVERTTFFCVQNHFDGKKIRRLQNIQKGKKSLELYGAFHAICAVASKCDYRGVLLDNDGPIDALALSAKTGFPAGPLQNAIDELSKPGILLLELHEISFENGKWVIPEAVLTWAVHRRLRRTLKSPRVSESQQESTEVGQESPSPLPLGVDSRGPRLTPVDSGGLGKPQESAEVSKSPPNGMEWNGREGKKPPAVPQGGQSEAGLRIIDPEEAKRLICKEILDGRDPGRPWTGYAQHRLDELTKAPGMPLYEIKRIAWFRRLPKNEEIPELKARRFPITETTLMDFWGDEFARADAYWKKNHAGPNGAKSSQKKEPLRWREFFRWKYPDVSPEVLKLPPTFDELPADQLAEWTREHEEFEKAHASELFGGKIG